MSDNEAGRDLAQLEADNGSLRTELEGVRAELEQLQNDCWGVQQANYRLREENEGLYAVSLAVHRLEMVKYAERFNQPTLIKRLDELSAAYWAFAKKKETLEQEPS